MDAETIAREPLADNDDFLGKRKKALWSHDEDLRLRSLVESDYCKSWHDVSVNMQDRSEIECYRRWQKVVNPNLKKGGWTAEEDRLIVQLVDKYGPKKWSVIASHLPGRIDKQCRERWHNHLDPSILKGPWTEEEDRIILEAIQVTGPRWAEIAKLLPGRTDNAIKNHWNSSMKRRVEKYLVAKSGKNVALQPFKGDGPIVFPCPVDEMLPAVRVKYSNYDRPGAGPVSAYDNRGAVGLEPIDGPGNGGAAQKRLRDEMGDGMGAEDYSDVAAPPHHHYHRPARPQPQPLLPAPHEYSNFSAHQNNSAHPPYQAGVPHLDHHHHHHQHHTASKPGPSHDSSSTSSVESAVSHIFLLAEAAASAPYQYADEAGHHHHQPQPQHACAGPSSRRRHSSSDSLSSSSGQQQHWAPVTYEESFADGGREESRHTVMDVETSYSGPSTAPAASHQQQHGAPYLEDGSSVMAMSTDESSGSSLLGSDADDEQAASTAYYSSRQQHGAAGHSNSSGNLSLLSAAMSSQRVITRVPDRNCAKGDLAKVVSLLQQRGPRPVSLVLLDGTFLLGAPGGFLPALKQLAPHCGRDTRFVFLHPNEAALSAFKHELQAGLSSLFPSLGLEVQHMYWLRRPSAAHFPAPPSSSSSSSGRAPHQQGSSGSGTSFSSLAHQVMPFLVAAPADTCLDHASSMGPSSCPAFIEDAPVLRDTCESSRLLSLGAPAYGMSPFFVATLVQRLCRNSSPRGLVVSPFDKYAISAAGAALARRDFVGLFPVSLEDNATDFEATCHYATAFLQAQGVKATTDVGLHSQQQQQQAPSSSSCPAPSESSHNHQYSYPMGSSSSSGCSTGSHDSTDSRRRSADEGMMHRAFKRQQLAPPTHHRQQPPLPAGMTAIRYI